MTAQVLLQFMPPLANHAGLSSGVGSLTIEEGIIEGETLGSLLHRLADRYGANFYEALFDNTNGKLKRYIVVVVNAQTFTGRDRLETLINDGDSVVFLVAFSGG